MKQYTQIKMRSAIEAVQVPPVTLVRIQNSAPEYAGFLLREDSAFQADGLGLNPGSRSIYWPIAQLVEHLTVNQVVRGSSPRRPAK